MRSKSLLLLVGAVAALAVACRDAVAPTRNADPLSASAAASFSKNGSNANRTILGTLELSPNGGTYHVGDFDIVVPADAVCDPATTKYGVKHWDDDCRPATKNVTVNVVAKKQGHGVSVDFQPDLRFRPSAGWVTIQTSAYSSLLTSNGVRQLSPASSFFQNFAILYVPTGGSAHVDEVRSTGDASMVTHVDLQTGLVWRRVKHFSGYLVTAGFSCPSVGSDGTCNVDPTNIAAPFVDASLFGPVLADSLSLLSVIVNP
ncbi:MAG TPA: hypothetical protein VGH98_11230 [Gemmatimonadaceae bacterium]|jgi:hypothetical protein